MHSCRIAAFLALVGATIGISIWQARATAVYEYKKNEFVVIQNGLSPDKNFAVVSHGEGEYGSDNFHLYLMTEPEHKNIGRLKVGPEILDSAPRRLSSGVV